MKDVWICLAEGFEEVEALTPADYLRRVGARVSLLSLDPGPVSGARGIRVLSDGLLAEALGPKAKLPDCIVVPGGMPGSRNLASSPLVARALSAVEASGGFVAGLCAAPALVLAPLGLLDTLRWTCYPGMEEGIAAGQWQADRVVVDGKLVTGRGAGCAEEFSLVLVGLLFGGDAREKLAKALVAR